VEVKTPSDIKELRLIHKTLENLLNFGPEFEALLMSRPEVQREEKWAWIWDARSPGGVYYRWKLWQTITNPRSRNNRRVGTQKPSSIFEGGANWIAPESEIKFEYTTRLDEFVSDEDYNSSDEEHSEGEDERRNVGGGPLPEGVNTKSDSLGYMNPLRKAKLTHLLARLPTTHAKLRRGDVARLTAFAIENAGAGADEIVDMIVLNILSPLAYTGANPERELEKEAARPDDGDKDNANASKTPMDVSAAKLVGLYIVSDILSSSATSGVRHAWRYRQLFEAALRAHKVFEHLGRLEKDLNWGRLKAEKWKRSVGTLLHLWEGWCVFPQSSQEHFVQAFEQPPLSDEEIQKEKEKADAERAASAFSKSKSRWKTVDDDAASGKFDPSRPAEAEEQSHLPTQQINPAEDESMSDIDGVPMEDSDLEMADDDVEPMEEDQPPPDGEGFKEKPHVLPEKIPEQQESTSQRPRRARPKAEDMFASDSE
jgi:U2-associated protein SR140